jgi:exonuclease SbcC
MQILSVNLQNFKIHRDRHFEFQPGVNAICGENGAGKTSILEAIAWVLFNYSSDYRKEELRYQDSNSAEVTVGFISAADGRSYNVKRRTSKSRADSYVIYDPQLNLQVEGINRVEDALQWLRHHLGMPQQTNLPKLFADVIGIPQGTFTTDFLRSATERRKVFDPILQVEDYKQAYQQANSLEKYALAQVQALEQTLGHFETRLQDWPGLQQQHDHCQAQLHQEQTTLADLEQQVGQLHQDWQTLKKRVERLQYLQQQLEVMQANTRQLERQQQDQAQDIERAKQAAALCDQHQSSYEAYRQLELDLQSLGHQRSLREQLYRHQTLLLGYGNEHKLKQAQVEAQLEQLKVVAQELETLTVHIPQQETLEDQQSALLEQLQKFAVHRVEQTRFQQQQQQIQAQLQALNQDITYLQRLKSSVEQIPHLEVELQRYHHQLAHVQAAQQFEAELRTIVAQSHQTGQHHQQLVSQSLQTLQPMQEAMPLFANDFDLVKTTLEAGINLHQQQLAVLQQILQDLSSQVNVAQLQQQIQTLSHQLEGAKRCQLEFARLATQQHQQAHLQQESDRIHIHLARLGQTLQGEVTLQDQHKQLQIQLLELGDPKGRSQVLQQQLQERPQLEQAWHDLQQRGIDGQRELEAIASKLAEYGDLDSQIQQQSAAKQSHETGYLQYVQNEKLADSLALRQEQWQTLTQELDKIKVQQAEVEEFCQQTEAEFNPAVVNQAEQQYLQVKSQRDQLQGALPEKQRELQRLYQELQQRQAWAQERDQLQQQLGQKQQVYQFILDARRIYNHSGTRITDFYLDEIRHEGDRLFRELINRPGVALNWTEDYEIQVQEGGRWRGFRTLSGGEQMAAALAVRLALLKVLAELDVAFFDEPTTNMDRDRRDQLADALASLKTFRQLFVISHDDTFENLTENIIRVERE